MTTRLNPYLHFKDQARDALEFYHAALGGTLELMTFGESGMADDPAIAHEVMHGAAFTESGLTIYAADTPPGMPDPTTGTSITVSLSSDDADLTSLWDALTDGAEIHVPFETAPWGDRFGMFTDKFGVPWLIDQPGTLP